MSSVVDYILKNTCVVRRQIERALSMSYTRVIDLLDDLAESDARIKKYSVGRVIVYCVNGVDRRTAVEHALRYFTINPRRVLSNLIRLIGGAKSRMIRLYAAQLIDDDRLNSVMLSVLNEYIRLMLNDAIISSYVRYTSSQKVRRIYYVVDVQKARRALGL